MSNNSVYSIIIESDAINWEISEENEVDYSIADEIKELFAKLFGGNDDLHAVAA